MDILYYKRAAYTTAFSCRFYNNLSPFYNFKKIRADIFRTNDMYYVKSNQLNKPTHCNTTQVIASNTRYSENHL